MLRKSLSHSTGKVYPMKTDFEEEIKLKEETQSISYSNPPWPEQENRKSNVEAKSCKLENAFVSVDIVKMQKRASVGRVVCAHQLGLYYLSVIQSGKRSSK